jgi:hypothetical protein
VAKAQFNYGARTRDGQTVNGTMEADTALEAAKAVLNAGMAVTHIRDADGGGSYDVSLDPGASNLVPVWRLAYDDGTRARWKTSWFSYVFGAVLLLAGAGMIVYPWTLAYEGLWTIVVRIVTGVMGGFFLLCGLALLLTKERMTVDCFYRTIDVRRSARKRCQMGAKNVREIAATWQLVTERSTKSSKDNRMELEAKVHLVPREGEPVELERCGNKDHARDLAAKVADYLDVPLRDELDTPPPGWTD